MPPLCSHLFKKQLETCTLPTLYTLHHLMDLELSSSATSSSSPTPNVDSPSNAMGQSSPVPHHAPQERNYRSEGWQGIEEQIALDSFFSGESERPLMELLASSEGIDVNNAYLRSAPFNAADQHEGSEMTFLGAVDSLVDLQSHYQFTTPRELSEENVSHRILPETNVACSESHQQSDLLEKLAATSISNNPRFTFDHENYKEPIEKFRYNTLPAATKAIRLVCNGPRDENGVISSLEMHTFDLDAAPPFYALSYVWGSTERVVPLTCNGQKLAVTNSLALALERSAIWSHGTYLWADGICINQDDVIERNCQVKFMGEIYARASKVLAHLPHFAQKHDESSEWSAISLMTLLNRVWGSDADYSARSEADWEKILTKNHNNMDMWATSLTFWMNPWFTRCWILQEGVLSDTVIVFFGAATCSLNAVTTFWDLARRRDMPNVLKYGPLADLYTTSRNLSQVGSLKRVRESMKRPSQAGDTRESVRHRTTTQGIDGDANLSLLSLLINSRSNGATDPRDKVYALLALANDDVSRGVQPDYSPENTVAKAYAAVAQSYIALGFGPELLYHAGNDHLITDLPSWVPDWSHQTRSTFNHKLYNCSGSSVPSVRAIGLQKLQIRGAVIDSIAYTGFACRYYSTDPSLDRLMVQRDESEDSLPPVKTDHHMRQVVYATGKMFCENLCSSDLYTEPLDLVLGRTLAADCTRSGHRSDAAFLESWTAYRDYNDQSLQMEEMSKKIEPGSEDNKLFQKAWSYEAAMQEVHKGRRICATKGGYFGIAPYDTEKEDVLVIFEGFAMPFVLRQKGEEYVLIGDAYVHGMMDGELICKVKKGFELEYSQMGEDQHGESFCIRKSGGEFATLEDMTLV